MLPLTDRSDEYLIQDLCEWADVLILAPLNADNMAKMLNGMMGNLTLEVLRSWDVSKTVYLIPSMTQRMWENPTTKKQISKIRRKWKWVRMLPPAIYLLRRPSSGSKDQSPIIYEDYSRGISDLVEAVKYQADLKSIGHDVDVAKHGKATGLMSGPSTKVKIPPELWTSIFEYVDDWEIAQALGVYTTIPTPSEWVEAPRQDDASGASQDFRGDYPYPTEVDWTVLHGGLEDFMLKVTKDTKIKFLSRLSVKLIIKFARTDILSYLEGTHKELLRSTFMNNVLPTKASAVFGRVEVLEWWRTSPTFLTKEYTTEAIDGASRAGFLQILDWWRKSGLQLRYTERALEQASSMGHVEVLEWWKAASRHQGVYHIASSESSRAYMRSARSYDSTLPPAVSEDGINPGGPLILKVGKSICFAAQNGQASTVSWWDASGIPYSYEETVPKIASASGHVNILGLWKDLKGEKMIYDNQVLVGPTKNGHADVLEWWKQSGFKVEYKTCDIEEALEDSLGGEGEEAVKVWWARNGLNLGVGTSEWMKTKVL
jgi:Flavoprotein